MAQSLAAQQHEQSTHVRVANMPLTKLERHVRDVHRLLLGSKVVFPMSFVKSYLRLPRYQRVLLGLAGVVVGWYGPSWMSRLFLGSGADRGGRPSEHPAEESKSDPN